ncbi:uncharacterized protein LOC120092102 [Benincasa hispida]|uniref:uncharacterized protein LOC120092102 n=1 Tax=Benincasa hispida TaxID=102211 RepID=UPI0019013DD1|nr:uncharacterized protein LOC120092102 [Benincasa hispida]
MCLAIADHLLFSRHRHPIKPPPAHRSFVRGPSFAQVSSISSASRDRPNLLRRAPISPSRSDLCPKPSSAQPLLRAPHVVEDFAQQLSRVLIRIIRGFLPLRPLPKSPRSPDLKPSPSKRRRLSHSHSADGRPCLLPSKISASVLAPPLPLSCSHRILKICVRLGSFRFRFSIRWLCVVLIWMISSDLDFKPHLGLALFAKFGSEFSLNFSFGTLIQDYSILRRR